MIPALAARTVAHCEHVVAGPWTTTNPVWQAACRVCVEAALREVIEAACRAVCEGCREDWPTANSGADLVHAIPEVIQAGRRHEVPWSLGTHTACDAWTLRALADAPAPERTP